MESGRLCLDFVATVGERGRRSFERLLEPEDLARWIAGTGMLQEPPRVSDRQLAAVRRHIASWPATVVLDFLGRASALDRRVTDSAGARHHDTTNLDLAGIFVWTELHPATAVALQTPQKHRVSEQEPRICGAFLNRGAEI